VGSRFRGKRLGRRLTERVNGGGAAAGIQARKRCSEGGTDGRQRGLPWGARSGDGGGKRGLRCGGGIRLLFERGQVRQGAVGVERRGRRAEEAGHEQGEGSLPTGEWRPPGSDPKPAGAHDMRRARCRPNRGGRERLTGGSWQQCWAAVPLTSGAHQVAGEGEGERSGALTGGTDLSAGVDGGARVSRPGKEKGGPSPDE
jgi:hypothetical protein